MNTAMILALLLAVPKSPSPPVASKTTIVLKVADRRAAADALVKEASRVGGYFSSRNDELLQLKIPRGSLDAVLRAAEKLGTIVQTTRQSEDVAMQLERNKTLLTSRTQVLNRYFAVLSGASAQSVITVEREMTSLVQEIERLKGQIRHLEHRIRFAELHVAYRFPQRKMPIPDGRSSFEWLNTVNLVDLTEEFAQDD